MRAEETRTVRLAARATGEHEAELQRRLTDAAVNVAVDADTPGALATAQVLLATLARGPGRISIDPTALPIAARKQLAAAVSAVRAEGARFAPPAQDALQVAVGKRRAHTVVMPDGHGARLSSGCARDQQLAPSMLGVVLTAALAAGEIFKHTAQISPERCVHHEDLAFCPVTLTDDLGAAAPTPSQWIPALTLAGLGAVGSAHALILSGLVRKGHALLLDRECFGRENLGTYTLGGHADVQGATRKVDLAARALSGWRVDPRHGDIAAALEAIDAGEAQWTPFVLVGLDNHDARVEAQRLRPEQILDAATGDTALGLRAGRSDGPCLRCLLGRPPAKRSPLAPLTALGIPPALARAPGEAVVDERLIAQASSERAREILRQHRGTPICGLVRAAGLSELASGDYMPSVPFVSQQAACLSVGRLLAIATGQNAAMPNFFQYDALIGPDRHTSQTRTADPDCECQRSRAIIAQVQCERRERAGARGSATAPAGSIQP